MLARHDRGSGMRVLGALFGVTMILAACSGSAASSAPSAEAPSAAAPSDDRTERGGCLAERQRRAAPARLHLVRRRQQL